MPLENKNRELDAFIYRWDRFVIDYWWRRRYNVPFGSKRHREMNFIDMLIEYRENQLVNKVETEEYVYQSHTQEVSLTQQEIDDEYENLDLEQYDNG